MKQLLLLILIHLLGATACSSSDSGQPSQVFVDRECGGVSDEGVVYSPNTYLHLPSPDDPLVDVSIADPHVILVEDTWYQYGTAPGRDQKVWSSTDLSSWNYEGVVWSPTPGEWNDNGGIWAPHVEVGADGKFYLYYTANERIGVAVSDSPTGPFADVYDHPFVGDGYGGAGDGVFDAAEAGSDRDDKAIDAFVLHGADGTLTFYYTAMTPFNSIYGLPMIDYTTLAEESAKLLIEPEVPSWEGFVNEGPWVFEYDGKYFLTYSGFGADRAGYSLGVAVSDHPLGPFIKSNLNPIFHQNPEIELWGPGHHSIAPGVNCDLLLFYHSKISPDPGWDRKVRYIQIELNEETGIKFVSGRP